MSHHLKVLLKSSLVESRREGNLIFYRRSLLSKKSENYILMKSLFKTIDELSLRDDLKEKVAQITALRSNSCVEFFEKNADGFYENKAILAPQRNT